MSGPVVARVELEAEARGLRVAAGADVAQGRLGRPTQRVVVGLGPALAGHGRWRCGLGQQRGGPRGQDGEGESGGHERRGRCSSFSSIGLAPESPVRRSREQRAGAPIRSAEAGGVLVLRGEHGLCYRPGDPDRRVVPGDRQLVGGRRRSRCTCTRRARSRRGRRSRGRSRAGSRAGRSSRRRGRRRPTGRRWASRGGCPPPRRTSRPRPRAPACPAGGATWACRPRSVPAARVGVVVLDERPRMPCSAYFLSW